MMKKRCIILNVVSSEKQAAEDKVSLEHQDRKARDTVSKAGWEIIDALTLPGQSRYFLTFQELEADAKRHGIDAYTRLRMHWEAKDFDILIIYRGSRLGRTQALHSYMVERTIRMGAEICVTDWGMVTKSNFRMWISMDGFESSVDIDKLIDDRKEGIEKRAKLGLPVSSKDLVSHQLVREANGKAVKRVVDESLRSLFIDLGNLLLEGIAYHQLEDTLYDRYQYIDANGQKYYSGYWYSKFMNPVWWGHTAQFHNSSKNNENSENGYRKLMCIFDQERYPQPKGVKIYWNTHEAVWQGKFAEQIKQEILRRSEIVRGRATPDTTHRYSGLCVCAECCTILTTHPNGNYRGLRCPSVHSRRNTSPDCNNRKIINEKKVTALVDKYLKQLLKLQPSNILESNDEQEMLYARLNAYEREIKTLENSIRTLIREQSTAAHGLSDYYQEEITNAAAKLEVKKPIYVDLLEEYSQVTQAVQNQHLAFDEIKTLSLERFWQQDSFYINQILYRLMNGKRFMLLDGEIIGVAYVDKPHRNRL